VAIAFQRTSAQASLELRISGNALFSLGGDGVEVGRRERNVDRHSDGARFGKDRFEQLLCTLYAGMASHCRQRLEPLLRLLGICVVNGRKWDGKT
jgi:hypothetical protein